MSTRCRLLASTGFLAVGLMGLLWLIPLMGQGEVMARGGAAILRVATTGTDAPGCGGAANPCRTIQFAVDAALPGDEIRVAGGVYSGVHTRPALGNAVFTATQVVAINKNLTLRGGYSESDWSSSDPLARPTTVDAQNLGRVLLVTGTVQVGIEGLRITGGHAIGLGGHDTRDAGGGVYVFGSSVVISNCEIFANAAVTGTTSHIIGYGGGLFLRRSPASVVLGNHVHDNTASWYGHGYGGGLYLYASDGARLERNAFRRNLGTTWGNGNGGGVSLSYSKWVTVTANEISDNVGSLGANYHGGGLYGNNVDRLLLTSNVIRGNMAGGSYSDGGGVEVNYSSYVAVTGNLIEQNTASRHRGWGGGMYFDGGIHLAVDGNVLSGNHGTSSPSQLSWGGGIYLSEVVLITLTNNALIGNDVTTGGGGLYVETSNVRALHNTVAANTGGEGTGVCITGTMAFVTMTNTIVAHHELGVSVTGGANVVLDHTLWHGNATDSAGTVVHTAGVYGDPLFTGDGYHIRSGSAALNQAVNAGVAADIDRQPRPILGGYDIGADEMALRLNLPVVARQ